MFIKHNNYASCLSNVHYRCLIGIEHNKMGGGINCHLHFHLPLGWSARTTERMTRTKFTLTIVQVLLEYWADVYAVFHVGHYCLPSALWRSLPSVSGWKLRHCYPNSSEFNLVVSYSSHSSRSRFAPVSVQPEVRRRRTTLGRYQPRKRKSSACGSRDLHSFYCKAAN